MKSPCKICPTFQSGGYQEDICKQCDKRIEYVRSIGAMTHSMPVDMMDARPKNKDNPTVKTTKDINPPALVKICTRAKCRHKGKPQPLDAFYNSSSKPDGKQGHCKSCAKDYIDHSKLERQKKKERIKMKKNNALVEIKKTVKDNEKIIKEVSPIEYLFSSHKDLLQKLTEVASDNFRTPEGQLLYIVSGFLDHTSQTKKVIDIDT